MEEHTYTISLELENEPGALVRVAQVFSRRGHNIDSLSAKPIKNHPDRSLMTIMARGAPERVEQITKQLHKLIRVNHVKLHEKD
jgi:acetolactate synthase I/III small subunit